MKLSICLFLLLFSSTVTWSMEDSGVLPSGIRHPFVKQGYVVNIGQRFDQNGDLIKLEDRYSKNFNATQLSLVDLRVKELVSLLDKQFPSSYSLGSSLNAGTLTIEADPRISYTAAGLAFGFNKKWTVAFGIPVVRFQADVKAVQVGSNIRQVENAISQSTQDMSPELHSAFNSLANIDLTAQLSKLLQEKGYKPLRNVDQTMMGDIQLISIYQYFKNAKWQLAEKSIINLPTGPKQDPDDLLSLSNMGKSSISFAGVQDYFINKRWSIGSSLGYTYVVPDRVVERVPVDENDLFPDPERKETVNRDLGDQWDMEANSKLGLDDAWSLGLAYIYSYKYQDYYDGSRSYNYSLLSSNTESFSNRIQTQIGWSTVERYMKKQESVPYVLQYQYSDILSGHNIERQTAHEVTFRMFF